MSEFLLIVPEGWVELDWEYISNNLTDMNLPNVTGYISSNMLDYLERPLKEAGLIPQTSTVVDARLIDNAFFMVRLG